MCLNYITIIFHDDTVPFGVETSPCPLSSFPIIAQHYVQLISNSRKRTKLVAHFTPPPKSDKTPMFFYLSSLVIRYGMGMAVTDIVETMRNCTS